VTIVCKGPSRISLNSSYNNRDDENYQADLGECISKQLRKISDIYRTVFELIIIQFTVDFSRVIPDGLIVFFPSYGVMTNSINIWKRKVFGCREALLS